MLHLSCASFAAFLCVTGGRNQGFGPASLCGRRQPPKTLVPGTLTATAAALAGDNY